MEAFVYCWTDHKNNMLYVGSHLGCVDDGYICSSKEMLKAYRDRPTDFTRQIVAHGTRLEMIKLEAKILQSVDAAHRDDFYNKHNNDGFYFDGWQKGQFTEQHRKNMSEAAKKRKRTPEHIAALHAGRRRSKNSTEHKAKLIESRLGTKHTTEAKEKMRLSREKLGKEKLKEIAAMGGKIGGLKHKGKILSEKTKAKISLSLTGRSLSEDTKRKLSATNKGENNPRYGKKHSLESRKKMSDAKKLKSKKE